MKRKLLLIPTAVIAVFMAVMLTACSGQAPDVFTILPSQTGFVIPLQDTKAQGVFQSEKYLKAHQVPAHQVQINYHGVSNNNNGTNYYPDALLVVVDRAQQTRNWIDTGTGGTTDNQAFPVVSSDGVQYNLEATCTGGITEEDAATYLFNFPSQSSVGSGSNPDKLEVDSLPHVMDTNVRGRLNADLAHYFNGVTIHQAYLKSAQLFENAVNDTTTYFQQRGLTLTACGIQGGPKPVDASIAASFVINANASNQAVQAEAKATAQAIINNQHIAEAQAQATVTSYGNNAQLQFLQRQGQLIQQYPNLTQYTLATKSNGQGPQVVLGSSSGVLPTYPIPVPTANR